MTKTETYQLVGPFIALMLVAVIVLAVNSCEEQNRNKRLDQKVIVKSVVETEGLETSEKKTVFKKEFKEIEIQLGEVVLDLSEPYSENTFKIHYMGERYDSWVFTYEWNGKVTDTYYVLKRDSCRIKFGQYPHVLSIWNSLDADGVRVLVVQRVK